MNFVLKDTKRWPFITGDCLIEVNTWVSLTVSWWNYIGCRPYLAKTFKWQYHTWIFMQCFDTQEIIICYSKNYNNLLKKNIWDGAIHECVDKIWASVSMFFTTFSRNSYCLTIKWIYKYCFNIFRDFFR